MGPVLLAHSLHMTEDHGHYMDPAGEPVQPFSSCSGGSGEFTQLPDYHPPLLHHLKLLSIGQILAHLLTQSPAQSSAQLPVQLEVSASAGPVSVSAVQENSFSCLPPLEGLRDRSAISCSRDRFSRPLSSLRGLWSSFSRPLSLKGPRKDFSTLCPLTALSPLSHLLSLQLQLPRCVVLPHLVHNMLGWHIHVQYTWLFYGRQLNVAGYFRGHTGWTSSLSWTASCTASPPLPSAQPFLDSVLHVYFEFSVLLLFELALKLFLSAPSTSN